MRIYFALVHHEPGSAWGVTFPDLPGCFAAADDEADLYAAAQEALSLYAEDQVELPHARSLSEVLADAETKADLADGAAVIGVPLIVVGKKARYNVMLDPSLVEGVDAAARAAGVSRSDYLAKALDERLQKDVGAAIRNSSSNRRGPIGSRTAQSAAASVLTKSKSLEVTSAKVATAAGRVIKDPKASKDAKPAATSALTQKKVKGGGSWIAPAKRKGSP